MVYLQAERAEFAAVVFHNILETYPDDADLQICYTVTADLVPTSRDWVGLFKVGWMYPKDYLYYEWAPTPINYRIGYDADASLRFPGRCECGCGMIYPITRRQNFRLVQTETNSR